MGHFSDDQNNDEFMNASAEEWSKPSTPSERPATKPEPTDRWGSPIPDKSASRETNRWGAESTQTSYPETIKKSGSKWWVILIVVLAVLCLCACLIMIGLSLVPANFLQF